jgi:hypothetical protein
VPVGLGVKLAERSDKQVLCQRKYQVEAVVRHFLFKYMA